jgi:hypothetical protein
LQFRKGQTVINKLKRLKCPDKIQKSPNSRQFWPDKGGRGVTYTITYFYMKNARVFTVILLGYLCANLAQKKKKNKYI